MSKMRIIVRKQRIAQRSFIKRSQFMFEHSRYGAFNMHIFQFTSHFYSQKYNFEMHFVGIIRHQNSDLSTVLMPLPSVAPPLTRKGKPSQSYPVPNFSTFKLDSSLIYPDVPPSKCVECKTEITVATHFT